jgi:GTP1/Obg family GTP-binding protein
MFNAAMKAVRFVGERMDIKKEDVRAANKAARVMDTLMKELTRKVNGYLAAFPEFATLHPFEQSMLDLSIGTANYKRILNTGDQLRKAIIQV